MNDSSTELEENEELMDRYRFYGGPKTESEHVRDGGPIGEVGNCRSLVVNNDSKNLPRAILSLLTNLEWLGEILELPLRFHE